MTTRPDSGPSVIGPMRADVVFTQRPNIGPTAARYSCTTRRRDKSRTASPTTQQLDRQRLDVDLRSTVRRPESPIGSVAARRVPTMVFLVFLVLRVWNNSSERQFGSKLKQQTMITIVLIH